MLIPLALTAVLATSTSPSADTASLRPRVFAPGVISSVAPDIAPAFLDGGRTVFFSRRLHGQWSILRAHRDGASWSPPVRATFSGQWDDIEAASAPGSQYLIFASDRPRSRGKARLTAHYYGSDQVGGALWRVELKGSAAAAAPRRLTDSINAGGSVWTPSIAANDDLAFMRTDTRSGRFRIFLAAADGKGGYRSVRPLAFSTGAANDVDPALDPAEHFLIFSSDRNTPGRSGSPGPEHLFIALSPLSARPLVCPLHFPGWSDPAISEVEPRLSPDGTRLYFASRHPDHEAGKPVSGTWDNGAANIWVVGLSPQLWRAGNASPVCREGGSSAHSRAKDPLFTGPERR